MRGFFHRAAAIGLSVTVTLLTVAAPGIAAESESRATPHPTAITKPAPTSLTTLSPASREVLAAQPGRTESRTAATAQPQPADTSSPHSFFSSKRGVVTLALMAAGVGFTVYSAHHDRQPVKSPVR